MKPDPRRLELRAYPFVTESTTRFADLDPLRHLNNVRIGELYEDGRVRLHVHMNLDINRDSRSRTLIAQITINYLGEGFYPDALQVGGGILRVGGASYVIAQGLFSGGRCIGTCDSTLVYTEAGTSTPLPDTFRKTLGRFLLQ